MAQGMYESYINTCKTSKIYNGENIGEACWSISYICENTGDRLLKGKGAIFKSIWFEMNDKSPNNKQLRHIVDIADQVLHCQNIEEINKIENQIQVSGGVIEESSCVIC